MCGFSVIYSKRNIPDLGYRIEKMTEAIHHRGPDAGKTRIINSKLALGHRRLSIIDLDERANQPMISRSGRYTIVFNGEIVNFQEIKNILDYPFITESDTEVILAGLEIHGIEWLLNNIQGMFSFVVYDATQQSLIIVRDPLGIKPLFYAMQDDAFICASEIKSILMSGLMDAKLSKDAIDEYLAFRYIRAPYTFFDGIYQVPCGHYAILSCDLNIKINKYWDIPRLNFDEKYNEKNVIEELDEKLQFIIKQWMVSDVKVGAYLSGGVDSSIVTAMMSHHTQYQLDTYTIGFINEGYNEFSKANIVASKFQTHHHEILIDEDIYFDNWDRLIYYKDSPLGIPNEIPLAIMTNLLADDITVVLSGEGADELFGGYGRIFRSAFDFNHVDNLEKNNMTFSQYFTNKYEYTPRVVRDSCLLTPKNLRFSFDQEIESMFKPLCQEEAIFHFFQSYHLQGLLHRLDAMTMQTSVEARPPFIDRRLIEFVYKSIPYNLKIAWKGRLEENAAKTLHAFEYSELLDIPKYALKRVAERYISPENIYAKKLGFPVPLISWYKRLYQIADEELRSSEWLSSLFLSQLLEENITEKSTQLIWMLLNIEKFIQAYFKRSWNY